MCIYPRSEFILFSVYSEFLADTVNQNLMVWRFASAPHGGPYVSSTITIVKSKGLQKLDLFCIILRLFKCKTWCNDGVKETDTSSTSSYLC